MCGKETAVMEGKGIGLDDLMLPGWQMSEYPREIETSGLAVGHRPAGCSEQRRDRELCMEMQNHVAHRTPWSPQL